MNNATATNRMDSNDLYSALYEEIAARPGQSLESLNGKFPMAYEGDVGMVLRTLSNGHQVRYVFDVCCGHNGYFIRRDLGADVVSCPNERRRARTEQQARG